MYLDFFDLKEHPFNLTPDTDFIFPSTQYSQAINYLLYGIKQKKGFILITGEVGAGKTTLCRSLLKKLDKESVEIAIILNSFLSEFELLKSINKDFSLSAQGNTKEELIEELNEFLLKQKELNRNVVLVIDECQNLTLPVLEQIRMLSNIETEKEKLLQIILIGQPEFLDILNTQRVRQLNQRITVRYHILPLNLHDMEKYILHRLKVASASEVDVQFTPGAVKRIFKFTKGIPRLVNVLCDYVLLNAFVHDTRKISEEIVKGAINEVSGNQAASSPTFKGAKQKKEKKTPSATIYFISLFFLLGFLALFKQEIVSTVSHFASKAEFSSEQEQLKEDFSSPSTPQFYLNQEEENKIIEKPLEAILTKTTVQIPVEQKVPQPSENPAPVVLKPEIPIKKEIAVKKLNEKAYIALELLKLWKIKEEELINYFYNQEDKAYTLEQIAGRFNFRTITIWSSLEILKKIKLISLVKLTNDEWGLLLEIQEEKVICLLKEGEKSYPKKEFTNLWEGETLFFYEEDFNIDSVLYEGLTGKNVLQLQERLWKLNFFHKNFTGIFDKTTAEAVKNFQNSYELLPDGVVGIEMQLILYRIFREDRIPKIKE